MVGWLSNDIAAAVASNKKIKKIMEEQPVICNPENPVLPERIQGDLTFSHVDFELDGKSILRGIDFTVTKGKTLGIMGVTGSGKSSIVNLIERFYDANKGRDPFRRDQCKGSAFIPSQRAGIGGHAGCIPLFRQHYGKH